MPTTTEKVSLTLRPETLAAVDAAAQAERRSRSQFIDMMLDAALDKGKQRLNTIKDLTSTAAPPVAAQPTPVKKRGCSVENHAPSTRRSVEESPTDAPSSLRDGVKP